MKRSALLMLAWLTLAFSVAHAIPARRPYELPNAEPERYDFRGTTWQGRTYEGWAMAIVFEPNGVLSYSYQGSSSKVGSWKSEANILYMEMNNKYCEFRGTVTGNALQGDSWNVAGLRWKTHLTRSK